MFAYTNLLAHYDKEDLDRKQFLIDHLLEVADQAKKTGSLIGLSKSCELIGLLHDLGKSNNLFQQYIRGEYLGRVNHSSAGAKILDHLEANLDHTYNISKLLGEKNTNSVTWKLYKEIIQYPILAHHGLYDIIDDQSNYHTQTRLDYDKNSKYDKTPKYDFTNEELKYFQFLNEEYKHLNNCTIEEIYLQGFFEFLEVDKKIRKIALNLGKEGIPGEALSFYYGVLVRLLLSILKEADIYDSSNYDKIHKDQRYEKDDLESIWIEMGQAVEDLYEGFNQKEKKSELDIARTKLADEIYEFAQHHMNGTYKLGMPVGSGKTFAALRFAVANAKEFEKSRIFYCTAFLSVLEQNAKSIREVIGNQYVLEHHSNIIEEPEHNDEKADQEEYSVNEYLKESWESPVILTTLVQFFNTLFKERSSNIRRFSKLINGIIIIDEIQSLPSKAIYNANLMMNFLTQIMNCNIVHCTATQPNLDKKEVLDYPCIYGNESTETSIVDSAWNPEVFERVKYYSLLGEGFNKRIGTKDIVKHVKEQLQDEMSALIVLNTKGAVATLYEGLLADSDIEALDVEILYLTTNQCPQHRLDIIERIKERTKELREQKSKRKLICVSTKLVEAGVDIDFDIVYRSLAGIDSIIQCGGRCNREGKKKTKGKLFIINYEEENLGSLKELKRQQEAAETALRMRCKENQGQSNINIEAAGDYYFNKLFLNEGDELTYPIGSGDTILNLLATNSDKMTNYAEQHKQDPNFCLAQGFKTAATNFKLIDEDSLSVIVHYNNKELIEELHEAIGMYDYPKIKILLRQLQKYTISIRKTSEYERYITRELEGKILFLNKGAYNQAIGLTKWELESLIV